MRTRFRGWGMMGLLVMIASGAAAAETHANGEAISRATTVLARPTPREAISRSITILTDPASLESISRSVTVLARPAALEATSRAVTIHADPNVTAVADSAPDRFRLHRSRPNPSSHGAVFEFEIPVAVEVRLEIFDVRGRLVRTLAGGRVLEPGRYTVRWDGTSEQGLLTAAGRYWYRMRAGHFRSTGVMTLLR